MSKFNSGLGKISGMTEKVDDILIKITKNVQTYSTVFTALLSHPEVFYNPELMVSKIILPMKNRIDFLKGIADEQIIKMSKQIKPILEKFIKDPFMYIKDISKIYDDLIKPYKDAIPILKNLSMHNSPVRRSRPRRRN